jgi:hypothetical protein
MFLELNRAPLLASADLGLTALSSNVALHSKNSIRQHVPPLLLLLQGVSLRPT